MKTKFIFFISILITIITNAQTWNIIGDPEMNGPINTIAVDSNNKIYVAGQFNYGLINDGTYKVSRWNFTDWEDLGNFNANNSIDKLILDSTNNVYCIGNFTNSSGKYYIAKYDGTAWSNLGNFSSNIKFTDIATDGTNIYLSGNFTSTTNGQTYYINKWDGASWSAYDLGTFNGKVNSLSFDKDGNLNAAGEFKNSLGYYCVFKKSSGVWSEVGKLRSSYPVSAIICDKLGNVYASHSYLNSGGYASAVLSRYKSSTNTWEAFDYYYPGIVYVDSQSTVYANTNCGTPCQNIFKTYTPNTTPSGGVENYVNNASGGQGSVKTISMDNFGNLLIASYQTGWNSGRWGVLKSSTKFLGNSENTLVNSKQLIYPNPSQGAFYIKNTGKISVVEVYDITGKLIKKMHPKSTEIEIKINNASKGAYIVKTITQDNQISNEKIIVK